MQVFTDKGIFNQPIFIRIGNEAMLVWLLTLVVVDKEQNPRLRTILQSAVHSQTTGDFITLLDVNWDNVIIQCILTDTIGLVS